MLGVPFPEEEKIIGGQYVEPKGEIRNKERREGEEAMARGGEQGNAITQSRKQSSKQVPSCLVLFRSTVGHPCSAINMSELFYPSLLKLILHSYL